MHTIRSVCERRQGCKRKPGHYGLVHSKRSILWVKKLDGERLMFTQKLFLDMLVGFHLCLLVSFTSFSDV